MKTLFIKSNTLHIRTNEGEFEVSPECYTKGISRDGENYWYTVDTGTTTVSIGEKEKFEWPYSYELIDKPNGYPDELCARLIPEEKKAESAYKEFEEEDKFSIPSVRNSPRSWPEDYEHENGNYISVCGECNNSFMGHKRRVRCKLCMEMLKEIDAFIDTCNDEYKREYADLELKVRRQSDHIEVLKTEIKALREEIEILKDQILEQGELDGN